ncbi:Actin-like protein arp9 [Asimina triloba]
MVSEFRFSGSIASPLPQTLPLSLQDYLKTVVPSQLIAERGSNLVVINPGSAHVRIGLAHQQAPFIIPQCIAWHMRGWDEGYQGPRRTIQNQPLNPQLTLSQHSEREKAYGNISSLLKVPFLDEDPMDSYPRKMGRVDGLGQQSSKGDTTLAWADVRQTNLNSFLSKESVEIKAEGEQLDQPKGADNKERNSDECKYREFICGEEAQRIPSTEPYCLRRPICRGHLNISQHYPTQQVIEDLHRIWDWILNEMLHIPQADRNMFSVILVVPETFDSRGSFLPVYLDDNTRPDYNAPGPRGNDCNNLESGGSLNSLSSYLEHPYSLPWVS